MRQSRRAPSFYPVETSLLALAVYAAIAAKTEKFRLAGLLAIGVGLACLAGCARFNPRGEGFRESFSDAAQYRRPNEPSAPAFGYSEKAREIERDFGVTR